MGKLTKTNAAFVLLLIILTSCSAQNKETVKLKDIQEKLQENAAGDINIVDIKTEDNINLKGTFYKSSGNFSVILLHMLGRNRNDWNDFAKELQSNGYNVLSIDFRGHGESQLNFKDFSENDFNKMVLDVKAAKEFLKTKNAYNAAIIGASIGANAAINYAAQDNSVKTVILLSPGLNYRGVKTDAAIRLFRNPILILASEGDSYSSESSKKLNSYSQSSTLKIYDGDLHGIAMLANPDVKKEISGWLKENLK